MNLSYKNLLDFFFYILLTTCSINAFTIDIFHRDSPSSPLYNASMSRFERAQNIFKRSIARDSLIQPRDVQSGLKFSAGDYLTKVYLGTPPVEQLLLVDTGSDLTWVQCSCIDCYSQDPPFYNPKVSTTFAPVKCRDPQSQCLLLDPDTVTCTSKDQDCSYKVGYEDGASTSGFVVSDSISFYRNGDPKATFHNFAFGCGTRNSGGVDGGESGMLGLGYTSESFVQQFADAVGGKFAHCLTPHTSRKPGRLKFGKDAVVTGRISSPLIQVPDVPHYLASLVGIKLAYNGVEMEISANTSREMDVPRIRDALMLDMGQTISTIINNYYVPLEEAMLHHIKRPRVSNSYSNLCFREKYRRRKSLISPSIKLLFENRELVLPPRYNFVEVEDRVFCFTFKPTEEKFSTLGNIHSIDVRIGFDLVKSIVYFEPMDCA
ncbi:aspartic proteinase CDR1-like [Andrographis paniculata]|uniref:aspartic proteinase CDR1-like n=1 Tax=Andrographis paniculata TaxID=175694 RepID=UPI0021E8D371|nr:aspartic proteinase CDR1-like [Andrographis paniculata]